MCNEVVSHVESVDQVENNSANAPPDDSWIEALAIAQSSISADLGQVYTKTLCQPTIYYARERLSWHGFDREKAHSAAQKRALEIASVG